MSAPRLASGVLVLMLVLPTLVVTIARLSPGESLRWVILRACTPVALITYTLAVIVLVAMTRGLGGAARSATLSALAVVSSLLLLHVWWFVGPVMADGPGAPTDDAVVVMTANLHIGRADPDAVLDAVDHHDVDVLILEEITPAALADLDRAGLDRRLQHRVGSAQLGRDGIMVFAKSPLGEVDQLDTSSPGLGVELESASGPLRVLAVHPTAPNNGVAQWSHDLDVVVAAARSSRLPTLVAGDFNATLDHPQLRALMSSRYRDASADAGLSWKPTWPSPGKLRLGGLGLPPLFALDHIFIRGPLEATDAHVQVIPGTDHRALVTRIAWTDQRGGDAQP